MPTPKCRLSIELESGSTYTPGEPITGSVVVRVLQQCRCKELSLFWQRRAQGHDGRDEGPSERLVTLNSRQEWFPEQVLRHPFRLEAPSAPFTHHGESLSVDWSLRAKAHGSGVGGRWSITEECSFVLVPAKTSTPAPSDTGPGSGCKEELEAPRQDEGILLTAIVVWALALLLCLPAILLAIQSTFILVLLVLGLVFALAAGVEPRPSHPAPEPGRAVARLTDRGASEEDSAAHPIPPVCAAPGPATWLHAPGHPRAIPPGPPPSSSHHSGLGPWLQVAEPREEKRQGPVPSMDVRRKLEGGIEVLEAARAHYTALKEALQERKWKLHMGPRLETLRETSRQEPALVGALHRLHQRARAEGWSETEPALALAREVEALRAHVGALASSRLGTPGNLEQLEKSVVQTLPAPLAPGELILFTGGFSPSLIGPGLLLLGVWFTHCTSGSGPLGSRGWLWLAWLVLTARGLLSQYHRSGRFWLTGDRLIWLPTRGEPLQVSLRDIHPQSTGVYLPKRMRVSLMDGRTLHLKFISQAGRLAAWLEYLILPPPVR